jgi:hypothetical protein
MKSTCLDYTTLGILELHNLEDHAGINTFGLGLL